MQKTKMSRLVKIMKRKPIVSLVVVALCAQLLSTTVYAATLNTITLTLDGEEKIVQTHASSVEEVLADNDIEVGEHDYLSAEPTETVTNDMTIEWKPAVEVSLLVDGVLSEEWTTEEDVSSFLASENITLDPYDKVNPSIETPVSENMIIQVGNAFPVTLNNGGVSQEVQTTATTVGELLTNSGIQLGASDRVEPSAETALAPNMAVNVTYVGTTLEVSELTVPFNTIEQEDPSLPQGTVQVVNEGQLGSVAQTFEVVTENGVVIARNLVSEVTNIEKVDKVQKIGTQVSAPAQVTSTKPGKSPASSGGNEPAPMAGDVVGYAMQFIGTPYLYGGTTPAGFDCSGFVGYCYRNSLGISLPRTSGGMASGGTAVANPAPGDVVYFGSGGSVSHVGIYTGNGQFISATNSGVKVDALHSGYWGPKYMGARRY